MAFWIASYCLSIAALVLCGASLAYVLRLRKGKASEIEAALAREVSAGQGPDPVAGGQEFAAHRNVDPQTGKVIYDMRPAPHSRTEVGTFAYVLAIAGIAALLPVYGLAAALAAGVLAPLAARRFDPSLERTVGFKLIVFSVAAACCGALASLLSCMGAFRAEPAGAPDVILPAGQLPELPIYVPLALLGVLVISVVMHESAHGLVAYWCGDPTAKDAGRLTLNPIRHFDFFGSFILPAMLFFVTRFKFAVGYAKPVPINASRFGRQQRDRILSATAGVSANFLLAACSLALLAAVAFVISAAWPGARATGFSDFLRAPQITGVPAGGLWEVVVQVLKSFFVVNLVLGIFNLIPVPPLDGSFVLEGLLPGRVRFYFRLVRMFGCFTMVVVLAILMFSGVLGHLMALVIKASALIRTVAHFN